MKFRRGLRLCCSCRSSGDWRTGVSPHRTMAGDKAIQKQAWKYKRSVENGDCRCQNTDKCALILSRVDCAVVHGQVAKRRRDERPGSLTRGTRRSARSSAAWRSGGRRCATALFAACARARQPCRRTWAGTRADLAGADAGADARTDAMPALIRRRCRRSCRRPFRARADAPRS